MDISGPRPVGLDLDVGFLPSHEHLWLFPQVFGMWIYPKSTPFSTKTGNTRGKTLDLSEVWSPFVSSVPWHLPDWWNKRPWWWFRSHLPVFLSHEGRSTPRRNSQSLVRGRLSRCWTNKKCGDIEWQLWHTMTIWSNLSNFYMTCAGQPLIMEPGSYRIFSPSRLGTLAASLCGWTGTLKSYPSTFVRNSEVC